MKDIGALRGMVLALAAGLVFWLPSCGSDGDPARPQAEIEEPNDSFDPPDNEIPPDFDPPVDPLVLYMSPLGSDEWSGFSPDSALLSLGGVQARLEEYEKAIDRDIEVRIRHVAGMPYRGQAVDWTHVSAVHTINFLPEDYHYSGGAGGIAGRPVFDGEGAEDWFFDLEHPAAGGGGGPTNIRFFYIRVQGYVPGAIRFHGDRYDRARWNGGNVVYGCFFYKLGGMRNGSCEAGFGALDLVNSDENLIRNNHFMYLENAGEDGSLIHGVYLAHGSERNLATANSFAWIGGDPIRLRDYSNFNDFTCNVFFRTGASAFISDWHDEGECRSWENVFLDNFLAGAGYSGQHFRECRALLDKRPEGEDCPPFAVRIHASGNDSTNFP